MAAGTMILASSICIFLKFTYRKNLNFFLYGIILWVKLEGNIHSASSLYLLFSFFNMHCSLINFMNFTWKEIINLVYLYISFSALLGFLKCAFML